MRTTCAVVPACARRLRNSARRGRLRTTAQADDCVGRTLWVVVAIVGLACPGL